MPVTWDYRATRHGGQLCQVKINNRVVSSAEEMVKSEARDAASRDALDKLAAKCYTVVIKNKYLSDGTTVDAADVDSGSKTKESLGGENVGHRLLKLMGWSGGGLGKGGAGISEPITAEAVVNREGLGSRSAGADFKQKVRKIIEEYAASSNPYDLVFTTGFDNEQRKEMHT